MGQASNVLSPGGDLLLTIHAHRGEDVGLYVRVVDFSRNVWKLVEETVIWGGGTRRQTTGGQAMVDMFASLRFGQPSLTRVGAGEYLATHWSVEEGQGRIRTHRVRIS